MWPILDVMIRTSTGLRAWRRVACRPAQKKTGPAGADADGGALETPTESPALDALLTTTLASHSTAELFARLRALLRLTKPDDCATGVLCAPRLVARSHPQSRRVVAWRSRDRVVRRRSSDLLAVLRIQGIVLRSFDDLRRDLGIRLRPDSKNLACTSPTYAASWTAR